MLAFDNLHHLESNTESMKPTEGGQTYQEKVVMKICIEFRYF